MCGGTASASDAVAAQRGLSPRVRGNHDRHACDVVVSGSIPACAGEPRRAWLRARLRGVYPRVCGGTAFWWFAAKISLGLSPRVRGNPVLVAGGRAGRGSIPACAGEPCPATGRAPSGRVYPRVCGGTGRIIDTYGGDTGLSPRVRGNLRDRRMGIRRHGSIPACAGEPSATTPTTSRTGVYPRVCGGTRRWSLGDREHMGLSPRVRGNQRPARQAAGRGGSIPACAGEPCPAAAASSSARVYPRVCGGTPGGAPSSEWAPGLSPRVRGNPLDPVAGRLARGSIPACAGEPPTNSLAMAKPRVYPRVCGGTPRAPRGNLTFWGLSPRVRGNRRRGDVQPALAGSIPACAGEPSPSSTRAPAWRVYPRVCGGTRSSSMAGSRSMGLSPRVRGNHSRSPKSDFCPGSIPACAGEPRRRATTSSMRRVYPRVCGGTDVSAIKMSAWPGLSPRVRGNHVGRAVRQAVGGSIPACAGEPTKGGTRASQGRVYPRVCGGTVELLALALAGAGLSPRVRGNRAAVPILVTVIGSIPACAGEPRGRVLDSERSRVYPRVCGGTPWRRAASPRAAGLSPRVRGNLQPPRQLQPIGGSIPACAGEPSSSAWCAAGSWVYPRVCGGT